MTYSSEVLADSPLCFLRLGEASGTTAADSSGNSHAGTYAASPTLGATGLIAGDSDTAVTFNGSSQYVSIDNSSGWADGTSFTAEIWVKASGVTDGIVFAQYDSALSSSPRWQLTFSTAGILVLSTFNGNTGTNYSTSSACNDGKRHHIVVTRSGTALKIYLDAAQVVSATLGTVNSTAHLPLYLAQRGNTGSPHRLAGTLDEFAFYSTALSATRVAAHYLAGAVKLATGMFGGIVNAGTTAIGATASPAATDADPLAATAGNLLVLAVMAAGANAGSCTTPSGWTSAGSKSIAGTDCCDAWVFYRIAAGGDAVPEVTLGSVTAGGYLYAYTEWTGLASSSPLDTTGSGATSSATGTVTLTDAVSAALRSFVISFAVTRPAAFGDMTQSWSGGSVGLLDGAGTWWAPPISANAGMAIGVQTATSTSQAPSVTLTGATANPHAGALISAAFKAA
jgi:hypothetical protein